MHVIVNRILGGLFRGLEQGANVHVKADIGEGGRDNLGAAVMAILAEFDHEYARPTALLTRKFF